MLYVDGMSVEYPDSNVGSTILIPFTPKIVVCDPIHTMYLID